MKYSKYLFAFAAIIFLAGCANHHSGASCEFGDEWSVNTPRTPVIIEKAIKPIKIDGNIDPSEWNNAVVYSFNKTSKAAMYSCGEPQKYYQSRMNEYYQKGTLRLLHDKNFLYVAVNIKDTDVVQYGKENQKHLYLNGDTIEVFVKPEDKPSYWEIYATPIEKKSSFFITSRGYTIPLDLPEYFRNSIIVKSKIYGTLNNIKDKDNGYDIEVAIPKKVLEETGGKFDGKTKWTILVSRYDWNVNNKCGWTFMTVPKMPVPNAHHHEYYGAAVFK